MSEEKRSDEIGLAGEAFERACYEAGERLGGDWKAVSRELGVERPWLAAGKWRKRLKEAADAVDPLSSISEPAEQSDAKLESWEDVRNVVYPNEKDEPAVNRLLSRKDHEEFQGHLAKKFADTYNTDRSSAISEKEKVGPRYWKVGGDGRRVAASDAEADLVDALLSAEADLGQRCVNPVEMQFLMRGKGRELSKGECVKALYGILGRNQPNREGK